MRKCIFTIQNEKNAWIKKNGLFHLWGTRFFQLDTNLGGTSTVAIIEEEITGEVFSIVPDNVRFIEKEENN